MLGQLAVGWLDEGVGDDLRYSLPEGSVGRTVAHVVAQAPFELSPRVWKGRVERFAKDFISELEWDMTHRPFADSADNDGFCCSDDLEPDDLESDDLEC